MMHGPKNPLLLHGKSNIKLCNVRHCNLLSLNPRTIHNFQCRVVIVRCLQITAMTF